MADATRILIVDDEIGIRNQLKWGFREDFDVRDVGGRDEAVRSIDEWEPAVVLLDVHLEGETCEAGFDILRHVVARDPRTKVIMVTGESDPVRASRAIELGAWDYYAKPIDIDELRVVVVHAARVRELQTHIHRESGNGNGDGHAQGRAADLESWLGRSAAARRVTRLIHSLASSSDPVLVLGEPGTGRELAGQALHAIGGREPGTYVALDVADGLPPIENLPQGGTYWIEDITRLSAKAHEHFPEWAESASERGRLVAGGPVDLAERAAAHEVPLRSYNFLAALTVSLPPLRERPDDIAVIATAMLSPLAARVGVAEKRLSEEALTSLSRYSWPGNLHELERRLTGALFVASETTIHDDDLWPQSLAPKQLGLKGNLNVLERSLVERAVREHHGNVSQAARSLSVSRPTLHSLLRKHDIDPEPFRIVGGAG